MMLVTDLKIIMLAFAINKNIISCRRHHMISSRWPGLRLNAPKLLLLGSFQNDLNCVQIDIEHSKASHQRWEESTNEGAF
jgi:putative methionine-R-sulfoxide reductase with GAF domain